MVGVVVGEEVVVDRGDAAGLQLGLDPGAVEVLTIIEQRGLAERGDQQHPVALTDVDVVDLEFAVALGEHKGRNEEHAQHGGKTAQQVVEYLESTDWGPSHRGDLILRVRYGDARTRPCRGEAMTFIRPPEGNVARKFDEA
jgi:hypothetical protein